MYNISMQEEVNPSIVNAFSAAAMRLHTFLATNHL